MTVHEVVRRLHWKSAVLSADLRACLFFGTTAGVGAAAAWHAAAVEVLVRVPIVGVLAAIAQARCTVEPAWRSTLLTVAVLPLGANAVEFIVHWRSGTPALKTSIVASLGLSVLATLFNQFAMRRGALLVGPRGRAFTDDFRQLPAMCAEFIVAPFDCIGTAVRVLTNRHAGGHSRQTQRSER